jgi:Uma2 family endonuclease
MRSIALQLPVSASYHEDNLRRWREIVGDPEWAKYAGKLETNRHENIIMIPSASGSHSQLQGEIAFQLRSLLGGQALPECPISTTDGVCAADVAWFSEQRFATVEGQIAFRLAPEICVEIRFPSKSEAELAEKAQLYLEESAEEVWIFEESGERSVFVKSEPERIAGNSEICPGFPDLTD